MTDKRIQDIPQEHNIDNNATFIIEQGNDLLRMSINELIGKIELSDHSVLDVVLDTNKYDEIINADGLINTLTNYDVSIDVSKTKFTQIVNDVKFIRLTKPDNSCSTLLNIVFNMFYNGNPIFCGYGFNKLNETQIGIGYATIRYNGENMVRITSIRSTMYIDGHNIKVLTNENLNNIKDENLKYYTNNFTGTNKPSIISNNFSLIVMKTFSNGTNTNYKQIITDSVDDITCVRYFRMSQNKWSPWKRILTEDDIAPLIERIEALESK